MVRGGLRRLEEARRPGGRSPYKLVMFFVANLFTYPTFGDHLFIVKWFQWFQVAERNVPSIKTFFSAITY